MIGGDLPDYTTFSLQIESFSFAFHPYACFVWRKAIRKALPEGREVSFASIAKSAIFDLTKMALQYAQKSLTSASF